jgi:hypothetical protein
MAYLTDRWKLIHIAALEYWSNATKQEIVMSALATSENNTKKNATECVLSSSCSYIKLLKKQAINSQNGFKNCAECECDVGIIGRLRFREH